MDYRRNLTCALIGSTLTACGGGGGGSSDNSSATPDLASPEIAFEGAVAGRVFNAEGEPLEGVAICLQTDASSNDCLQIRLTDRDGRYGLEIPGPGQFVLRVRQANTLEERTLAAYANYVWEPVTHELNPNSGANQSNLDFTGSFNFSNFQGALLLTARDFPELQATTYKTPGDYVFLKLYTEGLGGSEQVVFQNRIVLDDESNDFNFELQASFPIDATELNYEIYSLFEPEVLFNALPLRN